MSDFLRKGSTLFSPLCTKFAVNVFFSPETISKVDDVKTKRNVFFLVSFDSFRAVYLFFLFLGPLLSL